MEVGSLLDSRHLAIPSYPGHSKDPQTDPCPVRSKSKGRVGLWCHRVGSIHSAVTKLPGVPHYLKLSSGIVSRLYGVQHAQLLLQSCLHSNLVSLLRHPGIPPPRRPPTQPKASLGGTPTPCLLTSVPTSSSPHLFLFGRFFWFL